MPLQPNVSRMDIMCPGDMISYRCSVYSNSENVQLMWLVTLPQENSVMILYNNLSDVNSVNHLSVGITSKLTQFTNDQFITSELELSVLRGVSRNGTLIECTSEGLDSESQVVFVNTSGMH